MPKVIFAWRHTSVMALHQSVLFPVKQALPCKKKHKYVFAPNTSALPRLLFCTGRTRGVTQCRRKQLRLLRHEESLFQSSASHLNPQSTLGAINRQHLILTLTTRVNLHSLAAVALNLSHRGFTAPRINVSLTGGAISCVVRGAGAGGQGSRRAGEQGSRRAGGQGSRRAGEQGSRRAGGQGSRRTGEQESRRAGEQEGRGEGEQGSRRAGEQGSRGAGEQGSRRAGGQGSRRAGEHSHAGLTAATEASSEQWSRQSDDSQFATEASLKGRVTEEVECCCRPCQTSDSQPSPA